ncbi:hypothetical protein [Massilia sp. TSP1-1-2]|uniref:hypothetical protein n=1 Tax=Massilia sp. TSP1-1-2 TaxID=2804649 RepID=UPI003CF5CD05
MTAWRALVQLGDLALTLPAGAAIGAWLLAWRAQRPAAAWALLFALGIGLVGASKIAYLAWGAGWPVLSFKAPSGHAAGVAAVFPMLFYLLLYGAGARLRTAGAVAGLALGALVAVLLVLRQEHSAAEALAGWITGALVSVTAIVASGPLPPARPLAALVWFALVFAGSAWLMQSAHVGYWMLGAARVLSGNTQLFPLGLD